MVENSTPLDHPLRKLKTENIRAAVEQHAALTAAISSGTIKEHSEVTLPGADWVQGHHHHGAVADHTATQLVGLQADKVCVWRLNEAERKAVQSACLPNPEESGEVVESLFRGEISNVTWSDDDALVVLAYDIENWDDPRIGPVATGTLDVVYALDVASCTLTSVVVSGESDVYILQSVAIVPGSHTVLLSWGFAGWDGDDRGCIDVHVQAGDCWERSARIQDGVHRNTMPACSADGTMLAFCHNDHVAIYGLDGSAKADFALTPALTGSLLTAAWTYDDNLVLLSQGHEAGLLSMYHGATHVLLHHASIPAIHEARRQGSTVSLNICRSAATLKFKQGSYDSGQPVTSHDALFSLQPHDFGKQLGACCAISRPAISPDGAFVAVFAANAAVDEPGCSLCIFAALSGQCVNRFALTEWEQLMPYSVDVAVTWAASRAYLLIHMNTDSYGSAANEKLHMLTF